MSEKQNNNFDEKPVIITVGTSVAVTILLWFFATLFGSCAKKGQPQIILDGEYVVVYDRDIPYALYPGQYTDWNVSLVPAKEYRTQKIKSDFNYNKFAKKHKTHYQLKDADKLICDLIRVGDIVEIHHNQITGAKLGNIRVGSMYEYYGTYNKIIDNLGLRVQYNLERDSAGVIINTIADSRRQNNYIKNKKQPDSIDKFNKEVIKKLFLRERELREIMDTQKVQ
ncbi:MAG: hypothetical protein LBL75_00175 [Rickettsiales bacterium]|nr:hypothetical protein [Rickettsiales bacterium]